MENKKVFSIFTVKQLCFLIAGIIAAVVFFVITPFEGLEAQGMKVLGLFLMAIIWWMGSVFADYVTAFWMMALMIATKATTLNTVFTAFSGSVIWIVIPVLAIGAALSKTGLLRRVVLAILSKFKGNFKSQTLGFLIAGNLIDALIPVLPQRSPSQLPLPAPTVTPWATSRTASPPPVCSPQCGWASAQTAPSSSPAPRCASR